MHKIKITKPIINDFYMRELWGREGDGMEVYTKINEAKATRKDGAVFIEVNDDELHELVAEASFWSDDFSSYSMPLGEWMAYQALAKQCKTLMEVA